MTVIYLESATETLGDSTTLWEEGLNKEIKSKEIWDSLTCNGIELTISGLFDFTPISSYLGNIELCSKSKVVIYLLLELELLF